MKISTYLLLFIVVITAACKKEDVLVESAQPSTKDSLMGTWYLSGYWIDGVNYTAILAKDVKDYKIDIGYHNKFKVDYFNIDSNRYIRNNSLWKYVPPRRQLILFNLSTDEIETWDLLRLSDKEMKLRLDKPLVYKIEMLFKSTP